MTGPRHHAPCTISEALEVMENSRCSGVRDGAHGKLVVISHATCCSRPASIFPISERDQDHRITVPVGTTPRPGTSSPPPDDKLLVVDGNGDLNVRSRQGHPKARRYPSARKTRSDVWSVRSIGIGKEAWTAPGPHRSKSTSSDRLRARSPTG